MGSWAPLQTVASGRAGLGLSLKPAVPIVGTQFSSFVYTSVTPICESGRCWGRGKLPSREARVDVLKHGGRDRGWGRVGVGPRAAVGLGGVRREGSWVLRGHAQPAGFRQAAI